mmetsp:Transcript_6125/g.10284  ORF Transcript_6125/g.10284 Transcript_6125/m.10284 type:complete len:215 (-) Transcript_6125:196-840(-)
MGKIHFIQHKHVSRFDLLDQQLSHTIWDGRLCKRLAERVWWLGTEVGPLSHQICRLVQLEEAASIDNRNHVIKADASHNGPVQCRRLLKHGTQKLRFGHTRGLNHNVFVWHASHERERDKFGDRGEQVISCGAACTAIAQTHQVITPRAQLVFIGATTLHNLGINVDSCHIIYHDTDAEPLLIGKDMRKYCRLPSAQEAREYRHRDGCKVLERP